MMSNFFISNCVITRDEDNNKKLGQCSSGWTEHVDPHHQAWFLGLVSVSDMA